ncbi:MarR family winged helix-turn-helix transcriptional regulator [Streptomyces sp. NBC_01089]|uniref:MarR family winged helix-turn-helix transcriptional regulator n=1 Tax=Streptomyces sp. NBC_01089 TaxID=2903747 RepID=UPI003870CF4C|nr:MarR family transcriptional regulator [Streptomyces sp. NBC_01089]
MNNEATPAAAPAADLGLVDSLVQLSFAVQGALADVAAERGLSVIQLRLLGVLRDRTPGMQELARHLGLDKSSMTGLVDRAERRGLVRRAPAPHDGRAVQVSLTAQGQELARASTADAGLRIQALAAHLGEAQRTQLSLLASTFVTGRIAGHTGAAE